MNFQFHSAFCETHEFYIACAYACFRYVLTSTLHVCAFVRVCVLVCVSIFGHSTVYFPVWMWAHVVNFTTLIFNRGSVGCAACGLHTPHSKPTHWIATSMLSMQIIVLVLCDMVVLFIHVSFVPTQVLQVLYGCCLQGVATNRPSSSLPTNSN